MRTTLASSCAGGWGRIQLMMVYCITTVQSFDQLEVLDIARLETRAFVRRGLLGPEEEPLQMSDFNGQTLLMLPEEEAPASQSRCSFSFRPGR